MVWVWIKACYAPNIPPTTFAPSPSHGLESHAPSSVVYWLTPPHVSFYHNRTHFTHCISCEGIDSIGGNDILLYILIVVVPFSMTHDFEANMLVIIRAKFLNWLSPNPSKQGYALNLDIYGIWCTTCKQCSNIIEVLLRYLQDWIRKHPFLALCPLMPTYVFGCMWLFSMLQCVHLSNFGSYELWIRMLDIACDIEALASTFYKLWCTSTYHKLR
jgi:hypothetical protein